MTTSTENARRKPLLAGLGVALAVLAAALLLAACGSNNDDSIDPGTDPPDFSKAVDGAPKALAPLYADGASLDGGGQDAYEAQLAELQGYPVVVNKWASWCGPCRVEFPFFQDQAAERANKVAFMGIDAGDTDPAAETFRRDHPIPYKSYTDPNQDLSNSIGASFGQPVTIFYNAAGDKTYMHSGPYESEDALAADIDKYAVNG
jgi:cytochrome c biogenesis protein CcmG/thiol:disulfide interchange protein DsbE